MDELKTSCTTEAALIMQRLEELAVVTDEPGQLTRWFLSPAMARAESMIRNWMTDAGLTVRRDGWGNVVGRLPAPARDRPEGAQVLLCGSHFDTVRNAGKYDGALGVLLGIAAARLLRGEGAREQPWHLDIAAFSDEEGLRFQATYLGSRALTGQITVEDLDRLDAEGVRLGSIVEPRDELPRPAYAPGELAGYLEVHIEQGPVLEAAGLSLGVVTGIAGQTRARARFTGRADHAGTCPMNLRKDALAAGAELVLAVEHMARETPGLLATVGQLEVRPGASNVVPAEVMLTLDIRHLADETRSSVISALQALMGKIVNARGLGCEFATVQSGDAVPCDERLIAALEAAAQAAEIPVQRLPSGAGHDAAALAQVAPVGMLFVRSPGGISHHPAESVREEDVRDALEVLVRTITKLAEDHA